MEGTNLRTRTADLTFRTEGWWPAKPGAYAFSGGNVTLFARALALGPSTTLALLFYATVSSVLFPSLLVGRVRGALSAAERQLFLHAWHLRQIVPERSPQARA